MSLFSFEQQTIYQVSVTLPGKSLKFNFGSLLRPFFYIEEFSIGWTVSSFLSFPEANKWGVVTCPVFTTSEVNKFFKSLLLYNLGCS